MTKDVETEGGEWRIIYSHADGAALRRRHIDAAETVATGLYSYARPEVESGANVDNQSRPQGGDAAASPAGKEAPDGPDSGRRIRNRRSRQL